MPRQNPSLRTVFRAAAFRVFAAFALVFASAAAAAAAPSAAIVIDATTGKTLYAESADQPRYPASLTKMLTIFIAFEEIRAGRLSYDTVITVSANAARQAPTKLGLKAGSRIKLRDALRAVAIRSANDMAVAVAEHIAGSVPAFADRMNRTARRLGMRASVWRNPNGLPNPGQVTTARDMAILGRALYAYYPKDSALFATRSFRYGKRVMRSTNKLLGVVRGVEGIKTGYTRASGFNLVTSVRRDGRHIVAVVIGGRSGRERNAKMTALIESYLPRAKRGGGEPMLVADVSSDAVVEPAQDAAVPDAEDADETTTASLTASPRTLAATALPRVKPGAAPIVAGMPSGRPRGRAAAAPVTAYAEDPIASQILEATALAEVASAEWNPQFKARPSPAAAPVLVAAVAEDSPVVSDAGPPGWAIQIGAYPSKEAADAMLEKAKASGGRALAKTRPFTEATSKDGVMLYRARFTGFTGKASARAACRVLSRKSMNCIALMN